MSWARLLMLSLTAAGLSIYHPCPSGTAGAAENAAGTRSAVTAGKHLRVRYEPSPDPIPLNEPFAIRVFVEPDSASLPLHRRIEVKGWMPAHLHGMTLAPRIEASGASEWKVDGLLFHMSGHWQLFVDVMDDQSRDRATFDIELQ